MEIIRGLHNLRPSHRGCVSTIGNFDGVHRGHQAVLAQLAQKGQALKLPSVVITFEPQPQEFFSPQNSQPRLTSFREKMSALGQTGVDYALILRFNQAFSAWTATAFVEKLLLEGLQVRYLVVGDDFRFGHDRAGDFALLQQIASVKGFAVSNTHSLCQEGLRISSTAIRKALALGDFDYAAKLLGRRYGISGRVEYGAQRGRQLGFPTANISLRRRTTPLAGVYAVRLRIAKNEYCGVANIGKRPTITDHNTPTLEVHLFDFNENIYGRLVQVTLIKKLREEKRFSSLDELRNQIEQDAQQARSLFSLPG